MVEDATYLLSRTRFNQHIEDFSNKILCPKLCGFTKGQSAQHAVLNLSKNWLRCLDKSGVVGTVLHTIVFFMISFSRNSQPTALMNLQ